MGEKRGGEGIGGGKGGSGSGEGKEQRGGREQREGMSKKEREQLRMYKVHAYKDMSYVPDSI